MTIDDTKITDNPSVMALSKVIDETAFLHENFYLDGKMPATHYWNDRRRKAFILADKIIKAGYRLG